MLRAAKPPGRRDGADVGQHRLVTAGTPQLVPFVAVAMVRGIVDTIEVDQLRPGGQYCERLDLAAVGKTIASLAVKLFSDVAGLDGQHTHAVAAVQRLCGDRQ